MTGNSCSYLDSYTITITTAIINTGEDRITGISSFKKNKVVEGLRGSAYKMPIW